MFARLYIEALLVDKDLADQVWEAWDKGEIDDQVAAICWALIVEFEVAVGDVDGVF